MEGGGGGEGDGADGGRAADAAAIGTSANPALNVAAPPPFLSKTYDMVDDPATDAIVSWGPENNSFVVWNPPEFARDLLPKCFKHNNFSSFVRQLNTYGFRKVDPDRWEFANEGFLRGQKHLLKTISRRKPTHVHSHQQQPQAQNTTSGAIEIGKYGLEEEIDRLKRDKNVLMQELVKLRQQQQSTDHQLKTLGQCLQGMEQRQQQMMSFLAKAMQNPGTFVHFLQQNDSNQRITGVGKKRRLPVQDNMPDAQGEVAGQIIKYQPLINEAAKAMLAQILKFDASPRLEPLSNSDNLLVKNITSPNESFDNRSLHQNSGVSLSEVPTSASMSSLPANPAYLAIASSSRSSDIPSSDIPDIATTTGMPDRKVLARAPEKVASGQHGANNITTVQDVMSNCNIVGIPSDSYPLVDGESLYMNPMDDLVVAETAKFSSDVDMNILNENEKFPSINDPFWDELLVESPLPDEAEEVDLSRHEIKESRPESGNSWEASQSMSHLTKQMGNLTSEARR